MKLDTKSIRLGHTQRTLNFPYQVDNVGYVWNAPPVELVEHRFPRQIEVGIRLRSHDDGNKSVSQTIDGRTYRNNYPHVLVKLPDRHYVYRNFPERDVFYFCFDVSLLETLEQLGLAREPFCWNIELTPAIEFLMKRIIDGMNVSQEFAEADRIDISCFELLSELLIQRQKSGRETDPTRELISKIDSYMRFHVAELIDMDQLAEHFGLTRSSFFRYWKQYFPVAPAKYLADLKLKEACRRLSSGVSKVSEISEALNFQDTAYFCAVFRKKYGMTPLMFRKKYFKEEEIRG